MFQVRPHVTESTEKRHIGTNIVDVTAPGANVPLSPPNDWLKRWCTVPMDSQEVYRQIYEFEVRDDDVYVVTYPKCGTTWILEATWLLMHNLDFKTANSVALAYRSPFMDLTVLYGMMNENTVDLAKNVKSPRVLKTHFPAHLIPKQIWDKRAKIVYCARNPKDTVVSLYHFNRGLGTWNGTFDEFVEDFVNNEVMYAPQWDHVVEFWRMRNEDNIFFTTYEEMKRDLRQVLIQLNRFLEKPELSEEDLQKLEQHLSFEKMKTNRQANLAFTTKEGHGSPYVKPDFECMRRGVVGGYKDELSPKQLEKLDKLIESNQLKDNIRLEDIFGKI